MYWRKVGKAITVWWFAGSTVAFCAYVHTCWVSVFVHLFQLPRIFSVSGLPSLFYVFSTISILYNAINFLLLENNNLALKTKEAEQVSIKELHILWTCQLAVIPCTWKNSRGIYKMWLWLIQSFNFIVFMINSSLENVVCI